jgi:hypothetical protein
MVKVVNRDIAKGVRKPKKEVTILMDVHTILILILLQILTLFSVVGVVVILVNLRRAVDRNVSAGWEIEDRLKSLSSTLYEIAKRGDTKSLIEGVKEK